MKEHGLLLKAAMVRARAAGLKTQTRRAIAAHNSLVEGRGISAKRWKDYDFNFSEARSYVDGGNPYLVVESRTRKLIYRISPRIHVGDRIWWKETYNWLHTDSLHYYPELQDGRPIDPGDPELEEFHIRIPIYRATDQDYDLGCEDENGEIRPAPWKPSQFMPRRVARFTDTVTRVAVERIASITREDAAAEGVCITEPTDRFKGYSTKNWPEQNYRVLWELINGEESWMMNDHVWVYEWPLVPAVNGPSMDTDGRHRINAQPV